MEMLAPLPETEKMAGNSIFVWVITRRSSASSTEMLVKFVAKALAAFENPNMPQTIAEPPTATDDTVDRLRTRGPTGGINEGDTTTPDAFRLEQEAEAAP